MNPLVQTEWSLVIRAEMWGAREQRAVALCSRQPTAWIMKQKGGPELGLHTTAQNRVLCCLHYKLSSHRHRAFGLWPLSVPWPVLQKCCGVFSLFQTHQVLNLKSYGCHIKKSTMLYWSGMTVWYQCGIIFSWWHSAVLHFYKNPSCYEMPFLKPGNNFYFRPSIFPTPPNLILWV